MFSPSFNFLYMFRNCGNNNNVYLSILNSSSKQQFFSLTVHKVEDYDDAKKYEKIFENRVNERLLAVDPEDRANMIHLEMIVTLGSNNLV